MQNRWDVKAKNNIEGVAPPDGSTNPSKSLDIRTQNKQVGKPWMHQEETIS